MWGSMDTKIENQHSNLLIAQIYFGWISDTKALKWVEDIYSWTIKRVGSNAVNRPLNCDYFFISVIFRLSDIYRFVGEIIGFESEYKPLLVETYLHIENSL